MGFFTSAKQQFPWVKLTSTQQLDELIEQSNETPILLFKHSTRCGISAMVINRFEQQFTAAPEACIPVYLDLLAYRSVSAAVADKTGVMHQSPQALLLKDGKVVYNASHGSIDAAKIQSLL